MSWRGKLHIQRNNEVFYKKGVFRNFAKFIGKHLCQSLFFNKVVGLLKKILLHRCFPVNFANFLRTPFLTPLVDASEFSPKFLIRLSNFWNNLSWIFTQRQPPRGVLRKRCSENMRCSLININFQKPFLREISFMKVHSI